MRWFHCEHRGELVGGVRVLIEDEDLQEGRAAHQGPEVDGTTSFIGTNYKVGQYVDAVVIDSRGADLVAKPL